MTCHVKLRWIYTINWQGLLGQYANYTIDRKEVLQREPGLKSDV